MAINFFKNHLFGKIGYHLMSKLFYLLILSIPITTVFRPVPSLPSTSHPTPLIPALRFCLMLFPLLQMLFCPLFCTSKSYSFLKVLKEGSTFSMKTSLP